MTKKVFGLVVSALMALSLVIAACGPAATPATPAPPANAPPAQTAPTTPATLTTPTKPGGGTGTERGGGAGC